MKITVRPFVASAALFAVAGSATPAEAAVTWTKGFGDQMRIIDGGDAARGRIIAGCNEGNTLSIRGTLDRRHRVAEGFEQVPCTGEVDRIPVVLHRLAGSPLLKPGDYRVCVTLVEYNDRGNIVDSAQRCNDVTLVQ